METSMGLGGKKSCTGNHTSFAVAVALGVLLDLLESMIS